MKKSLIIIMMFITVLSISSCIFENQDDPYPPCPYGKWENKLNGLIIDIKPELGIYNFWFGKYYNNGEEKEILISITYFGGMSIYDAKDLDGRGIRPNAQELFCGMFQVENDKLYFTLTSRSQKITGIKDTIVFEQIEEFEVPVVSGSFASSQENS